MKHFYLRVTARSPLTIRSDHAEGGFKTTSYIPGATLLGSLATSHRILHPERRDEFASLFLNEEVCFPHLYPATFGTPDFQEANVPVMPFPKTAQTCKRFSGFVPLQSEFGEVRHGVRDTLLDWGLFSLARKDQLPIPTLVNTLDSHEFCRYAEGKYKGSSCHRVMDHISGYYRRIDFETQQHMQAKLNKRLQTRTGINREWGVVEERILYNREVFDEGMIFWGNVLLPDELVSTFSRFMREANREDVISIGTGRTRGLGHIETEIGNSSGSSFAEFEKKLDNFHAAMVQQAQTAQIQHVDPFYFAITLQSPVILCDAFLRYQNTLDAKSLADLSGLPRPTSYTFERIYQATGTQRITGWNELWGTPRPNEYAIEAGSTFLFACKQQAGNDLKQALYKLEEVGIGRRRSEGFGRISISDPFHLEREQI